MKVSIITVTYNSERTLSDTIRSVLCQKYNNIEYIIIDGGSSDSTISLIQEYEPLFHDRMKWISEKDQGIYDAMNKGIKLAAGNVIGILNSDDVYTDNNVVSDIMDVFENAHIDALYADLEFVSSKNLNKTVRTWKGSSYKIDSFKKGWHPAHPTFYVSRSVYEKYGLFDLTFGVSSDFELMLRFIEKYQISTYYLNRGVVKMRMGGESTGSILKMVEGNKNVLKAFKKNNIPVSSFYLFYRLIPKMWNIVKAKFAK